MSYVGVTVMQDIKFPMSLDVFDLCTPELQQRLTPERDRFKAEEDKRVEIAQTVTPYPVLLIVRTWLIQSSLNCNSESDLSAENTLCDVLVNGHTCCVVVTTGEADEAHRHQADSSSWCTESADKKGTIFFCWWFVPVIYTMFRKKQYLCFWTSS